MNSPGSTEVFISYAHKDGAKLAQELQQSLATEGFDAWLDKERLTGGGTWTSEIEQAIDRSQVLLALMSPVTPIGRSCAPLPRFTWALFERRSPFSWPASGESPLTMRASSVSLLKFLTLLLPNKTHLIEEIGEHLDLLFRVT